jgi:hypothetical protein
MLPTLTFLGTAGALLLALWIYSKLLERACDRKQRQLEAAQRWRDVMHRLSPIEPRSFEGAD